MKARNARRECFRLLNSLIGPATVPQFLKTPQPALGDMTGAQLLQHDPAALLKRLRALEQEMEAGS